MDAMKIFSEEHLQELQSKMDGLQGKMHGLALGMTLGLGTMYIGQGCPTVGQ